MSFGDSGEKPVADEETDTSSSWGSTTSGEAEPAAVRKPRPKGYAKPQGPKPREAQSAKPQRPKGKPSGKAQSAKPKASAMKATNKRARPESTDTNKQKKKVRGIAVIPIRSRCPIDSESESEH